MVKRCSFCTYKLEKDDKYIYISSYDVYCCRRCYETYQPKIF